MLNEFKNYLNNNNDIIANYISEKEIIFIIFHNSL